MAPRRDRSPPRRSSRACRRSARCTRRRRRSATASRSTATSRTGRHAGPDQLDIYRPVHRPGPWPVVFYVHGGAFHLLSKDTHWLMGLVFARFGYLVVNISYRLAPTHPYPAAIEDTCRRIAGSRRASTELGGDPTRVAVAGESAGGNLITALTLAACQRAARAVGARGVRHRARAARRAAVLRAARGHQPRALHASAAGCRAGSME